MSKVSESSDDPIFSPSNFYHPAIVFHLAADAATRSFTQTIACCLSHSHISIICQKIDNNNFPANYWMVYQCVSMTNNS